MPERHRAPYCQHYSECLSKAIQAGLDDFSCQGCENHACMSVTPAALVEEVAACERLAIRVYYGKED